jgi:hypothetical protein
LVGSEEFRAGAIRITSLPDSIRVIRPSFGIVSSSQ